tara:strand:- start:16 stop:234 length:219 start_codon:yes stop_codon:yes gene_type:complete
MHISDVLIRFISKGNNNGILSTAIIPPLLFVFDAIAAINVKSEAMAELPNTIHRINDILFEIGFPKNILYMI